MGETTGISWTDHTWNPWHGCIKVSPGCKNCYMYREKKQYGQQPDLVVRSKTTFNSPLKWESGRVFTCSWSDFFIEQADAWRDEAWNIIRRTPHLTYQILTKRPELMARRLPKDWGEGYPNVWLGVSAEDQKYADLRVPILIDTPARIRFVSAEPLLDGISVKASWIGNIHWVIVGGESGPGARPCDMRWMEALQRGCHFGKIAFFLKQFGSRPTSGGIPVKVTKSGTDPLEWPEYLRVQEFPEDVERVLGQMGGKG